MLDLKTWEDMTHEERREANDRFRRRLIGGRIVMTQAVYGLGALARIELQKLVQAFDTFTEDNDPWGEHDFGRFEYQGEVFFWKIDWYEPTTPTLIIMYTSEY